MLKWIVHPLTLAVAGGAALAAVTTTGFFDAPDRERTIEVALHSQVETPVRPTTAAELAPAAPVTTDAAGWESRGEAAALEAEEKELSAIELWRAARLAAWRGELERSVSLYRELEEREPKSVDAPGELGNVLMRMGDWNAAAEAFGEAAMRAHADGQVEGAWYLHSVVAGLDPERAANLRERLAEESAAKSETVR